MWSALPDPAIVGHPVSSAGQTALEVTVGAAIVGLFVIAVRIRQRWGTSMGFVILAATLLASGVEVIFNTAADFWYYAPGQHALFSTWGRSLPVWALGSYVPFYGGLGMAGWYLLERGFSRRRMAMYVIAVWLFAVLTEISLIGLKVYRYYGPQPFRIADFPVWISTANAGICASVAIGAARLSRVTSGWRQWQLVVVGPPLVSGFLLGTTFPVISLLQSSHPSAAATDLAAAAAIGLAAALIVVVLGLVPRDGLADSLNPARAEPARRATPRRRQLTVGRE